VVASAASVGGTLLLCLAGALWARWRTVEPAFWRLTSRLNADVLTPALCFHTMVKELSPRSLQELWVVPVASLAHILVGLALGGSLGRLVLPGEQRSEFTLLAMLATSMGNSFALPLPLMVVLCRTVPWLSDRQEECTRRATGILIIWAIVVVIILWSLGYLIVHRAMARRSNHASSSGAVSGDADKEAGGAEQGVGVPEGGGAAHLCHQGTFALRQMLNPVVVSSLVGLGVAMVGPLQDWLNGSLIMTVLDMPARACVPLTLLCLGGQMVGVQGSDQKQAAGGISPRVLAAFTVLRLIIMNGIWSVLVVGALWAGLLPRGDRLLQLCLLLPGAMPTAANVVLLCGVLRAFPTEISRLIFIMQVACVPCIAISLIVYLEIVES
jgi:predicted permease